MTNLQGLSKEVRVLKVVLSVLLLDLSFFFQLVEDQAVVP